MISIFNLYFYIPLIAKGLKTTFIKKSVSKKRAPEGALA